MHWRSHSPFKGLLILVLLTGISPVSSAQVCATALTLAEPAASETLTLSNIVQRGLKYIQKNSEEWMRDRRCLCCHTTVSLSFAQRFAPGTQPSWALNKIKEYSESRASRSERPWYTRDYDGQDSSPTESIIYATSLVLHNLRWARELEPSTKVALDQMLLSQRAEGGWHWLNMGLRPMETAEAEVWGNSMGLLVVGMAKKELGYIPPPQTVDLLTAHLRSRIASDHLHGQMMSIWANSYFDNFLPAAQKQEYVQKVLSSQKADGSWNTKEISGVEAVNSQDAGDAYATAMGLIVILETQGINASATKAYLWLLSHQSEAGSWVGKSMNRIGSQLNDQFASDTATGFSLYAIGLHERMVVQSQIQSQTTSQQNDISVPARIQTMLHQAQEFLGRIF